MRFPIRQIHQIEMTSRCNLRCKYCTHPNLGRPKQDMSAAHFTKALSWAKRFVEAGQQDSVNMAGIGESTLHPDFVRNMFWARKALGEQVQIVLATNGLLMDDAMAQAIAPMRPTVYVSLHRPERAGLAVEACKRAGILAGVSADPSVAATNWAGQVKWHVSVQGRRKCMWVSGGQVIVQADGNVSRCAYDAGRSNGVICTIDDDLAQFTTSAYSLCRGCDQDVGVPYGDDVPVAAAVQPGLDGDFLHSTGDDDDEASTEAPDHSAARQEVPAAVAVA